MRKLDLALNLGERLVGRRGLWRLGRAIYAYGRSETANAMQTNGERALVAGLLRAVPDPVVFDVGANLGLWSKMALAEGARRITAFEPVPAIRANLEGLPITIEALAVADQVGTARFVVRGASAGSNSLFAGQSDGEVIEVATTTVAAYAEAHGIDAIDLLKIDVEGFDLFALRGALPLFEAGRIGVAQFEYNCRWIETRSFLKDVFDLAAGLPRYRLGKLTPDGIILFEAWHYELERWFEANYVLVRDDLIAPLGARTVKLDEHNTFG